VQLKNRKHSIRGKRSAVVRIIRIGSAVSDAAYIEE